MVPFEEYADAAKIAIDEDYAEVIVLGCAGLCNLTKALREKIEAIAVMEK